MAVTILGSPLATFCNSHSLVPKNSTMTTMQTPFTSPSPFTCSAPLAAKVAFLPKLLKPNKKMQELPKSPSSLVFYSLSSSALPTVLTTPMHGKAGSFLNCVFNSFLAMMHNSLKPSHFLFWIWNTPFTCLSPLSPVSSPGLSKFLFIASLTPLDGRSRLSAAEFHPFSRRNDRFLPTLRSPTLPSALSPFHRQATYPALPL